jgi:adenylosuccinate lyase
MGGHSMLARTHGQPSPTRLGKEIGVFVERLEEQMRLLFNIPFAAKFGGATGNYNAHHVAYPQIDWRKFGGNLLKKTWVTPLFPDNTNRTLRSFCCIF